MTRKPTTKKQRQQRDAAVKKIADGLAALERLGVYSWAETDHALGFEFAHPMDEVSRAVKDMRAASMRDDVEGVR